MYNLEGIQGYTINDWVLIGCVVGGLLVLIFAILMGFGKGNRNW